MTTIQEPDENSAADARQEQARLQARMASMRALLVRLLQDVVRTESRMDSSHAAQLLEVNEQLLVSALNARTEADTATQSLDALSVAAQLDVLTQLPNRSLLLDRLRHAIATARRHGGRLALLFLDLDGFKHINDTRGHAAGDQVLRQVAACLLATVRAADTVSRYGGDEFLILLTEVSQPSDAALLASKMIAAIRASGVAGDLVHRLNASVGISLYPDDGEDPDTLIRQADAAMYHAKRQGPGTFAFHGRLPACAPHGQASPRTAVTQTANPHALALAEHRLQNAHLREANEKLVVAALDAQELQARAEQALQRQAELMATVAQELQNPLAPIHIAAAMLGRAGTDGPLLPRLQAIVEHKGAQIFSLVGALREHSKKDSGLPEGALRAIDMVRVIGAAIADWRPVMEERQQQFDVRLPTGPQEVHGDADRLAQLVANLLDNASNFTQEGGRISLVVERAGRALVITVTDNGMGITPEVLPDVFDSFVQDTHAIGLHGVGPGIGLTVVCALVQAHGGTVVAHSAGLGLGSRFVVTLPLENP